MENKMTVSNVRKTRIIKNFHFAFKIYVKKLKRAKGRRDIKALGRIRNNKPSYKIDHIVKERWVKLKKQNKITLLIKSALEFHVFDSYQDIQHTQTPLEILTIVFHWSFSLPCFQNLKEFTLKKLSFVVVFHVSNQLGLHCRFISIYMFSLFDLFVLLFLKWSLCIMWSLQNHCVNASFQSKAITFKRT